MSMNGALVGHVFISHDHNTKQPTKFSKIKKIPENTKTYLFKWTKRQYMLKLSSFNFLQHMWIFVKTHFSMLGYYEGGLISSRTDKIFDNFFFRVVSVLQLNTFKTCSCMRIFSATLNSYTNMMVSLNCSVNCWRLTRLPMIQSSYLFEQFHVLNVNFDNVTAIFWKKNSKLMYTRSILLNISPHYYEFRPLVLLIPLK